MAKLDISEKQRADYCYTARVLRDLLYSMNAVVLKVYDYSGSEHPGDLDVFVSSEDLLKFIKRASEMLKAKIVRKKRFLTSSYQLISPELPLEIDVYYVMEFSPSLAIYRISGRERMNIPWCSDTLDVPVLRKGLDSFFILFHAIRHKRFTQYEIRTLINRICSFTHEALVEFITYVKRSDLELETLASLYTIALIMLNERKFKDAKCYSNILMLLKYLRRYGVDQTPRSPIRYLTRYLSGKINKTTTNTRNIMIHGLFIIMVLRNFKRVKTIDGLYRLIRSLHVLTFYEYVILLLLKLKLLK